MERVKGLAVAVALLAALMGTGCLSPHYVRSNPAIDPPKRTTFGGLTEHIVLISIDGLRPDAISQFGATTLKQLMLEGSATLSATTILPSKTLPSHTSMLTGQPPSVHGVSWNTKLSLNKKPVQAPTVFEVLRPQGFITAAFFSKPKFTALQRPGSLDYSEAPGGWWGHWSAERVVRDVEAYLNTEQPNLLFVHFGDVDGAGHDAGWMSAKYGQAVQRVDAAVERVKGLAEHAFGAGNFTLIVTADHGGHGRDHGSEDPRDVTIPWIAWGKGVRPGQLSGNLKTMDTAATLLWLFRVDEPADWAGIPVVDAF
jgi:predicted AlkP superfamily pyrophosphatase or phosphodiesterase